MTTLVTKKSTASWGDVVYMTDEELRGFKSSLDPNFKMEIYHSEERYGGNLLDKSITDRIMNFIESNHMTDYGSVDLLESESFERLLKLDLHVSVMFDTRYTNKKKNERIVGTVFSFLVPVKYYDGNEKIYTSHTTFLCIHNDYRKHGLSAFLITNNLIYANSINIDHGYYTSARKHIDNGKSIRSWYRVIDYNEAVKLGYDVPKKLDKYKWFKSDPKKNSTTKVTSSKEDYDRFVPLLVKKNVGCIYLAPDYNDFVKLVTCFDFYFVNNDKTKLFALFPFSSITTTGKKSSTLHLVFTIGDCIDEAIEVCHAQGKPILYGWCYADITFDIATVKHHCIESIGTVSIEMFGEDRDDISSDRCYVPLI